MGINKVLNDHEGGRLHDTTDELNHTVSDTAKGPDCEDLEDSVGLEYGSTCREATYSIRIPGTVFNLIVLGPGSYLST